MEQITSPNPQAISEDGGPELLHLGIPSLLWLLLCLLWCPVGTLPNGGYRGVVGAEVLFILTYNDLLSNFLTWALNKSFYNNGEKKNPNMLQKNPLESSILKAMNQDLEAILFLFSPPQDFSSQGREEKQCPFLSGWGWDPHGTVYK